jgi:hypothetical protein
MQNSLGEVRGRHVCGFRRYVALRGHPPAGRDRAKGEGQVKEPIQKPCKLARYIEWTSRGRVIKAAIEKGVEIVTLRG